MNVCKTSNKNVEPYAIIGGNQVKEIRYRFNKQKEIILKIYMWMRTYT